MLERTFASTWLRVCVGVFAALALVLATTAPASARERGPAAHLVARRGPHAGPRTFHDGAASHGARPYRHHHHRHARHFNPRY